MKNFFYGLCIAIALLKLAGVATVEAVSWWLVFSPIWLPFAVLGLIVAGIVFFTTLIGIAYGVCWIVDKFSR